MPYRRIHVFYSGYVQGVGFRFTARSTAAGLGLVGWARNMRDGRVEVVCEGEEKKLKQFLDDIKNEFLGNYIRDVDISWEEARGQFSSFDIKF